MVAAAASNLTGLEDIVKATSNKTTTATQKSLGKDDFLKMLLAQLKNQDPTQPMSGTDFSAQLAQFSQLEQLRNMSDDIKNQSLTMMTMSQTQAIGMIGKEVSASGINSVTANGSPVDLSYVLDKDAAQVVVSILDKDGKVVKSIENYNVKAGPNKVTWKMDAGTTGSYTYQVAAMDENNNDLGAKTSASGLVDSVQFKDNKIYVIVNGQELPFADVKAVRQKS